MGIGKHKGKQAYIPFSVIYTFSDTNFYRNTLFHDFSTASRIFITARKDLSMATVITGLEKLKKKKKKNHSAQE